MTMQAHIDKNVYTTGAIDQTDYAGSKQGYLGSKAASGAYQAIIASMPPHKIAGKNGYRVSSAIMMTASRTTTGTIRSIVLACSNLLI